MAIKKIKIVGAVLELPAKQHCQFSLSTKKMGQIWQYCLAGSSKMAPRILIFSMAMDADYTFELISIKTSAPQFKWHNKSFLGSVTYDPNPFLKKILNTFGYIVFGVNFFFFDWAEKCTSHQCSAQWGPVQALIFNDVTSFYI